MNVVLGAKIRNLRINKKYTQEQIASAIGCSAQKYAKLERGLIDITFSDLTVIARVLDVDVKNITACLKNVPQSTKYKKTEKTKDSTGFEFVIKMINTFYAHKKLYNNTRRS